MIFSVACSLLMQLRSALVTPTLQHPKAAEGSVSSAHAQHSRENPTKTFPSLGGETKSKGPCSPSTSWHRCPQSRSDERFLAFCLQLRVPVPWRWRQSPSPPHTPASGTRSRLRCAAHRGLKAGLKWLGHGNTQLRCQGWYR